MTLYDPLTLQPHKTITRFKDVALSASFRQDGRLLTASSADGIIQSFDLSSRLILRTFRGHTAAVWSVRHSSDFGQLLSAGDDGQVRVWDVSSEQCVRVWQAGSISGSGDNTGEVRAEYVRVVREVEGESDIVVSGGYDGVVRYWDKRVKDDTPILTLSHGAPINALLLIPKSSNASALSCISAADVTLKAWDIRYIASSSAISAVHTLSTHQKAITSLSADTSYSKLLSGSLDGFVKVTSLPSFTPLSSIKHTAPILSLALSPDSSTLAIGSADGSLTLKQRPAPPLPPQPRPLPRMGSHAWFNRGASVQPPTAANAAAAAGATSAMARRSALQAYDVYLKRFQYHQALDAALRTNRAATIAAMLEELIDRSALLVAISGRTEESLAPLLFFLLNYLVHPVYSGVMLDVIGCVLSVYGRRVGESVGMDEWVRRVRERVRDECGVQEAMVRMRGGMEMMWRASETIEAGNSDGSRGGKGDMEGGEGDSAGGSGGGGRVEEVKEDGGEDDVDRMNVVLDDEVNERKETELDRTDRGGSEKKKRKKKQRNSENSQRPEETEQREEKQPTAAVASSARKKHKN